MWENNESIYGQPSNREQSAMLIFLSKPWCLVFPLVTCSGKMLKYPFYHSFLCTYRRNYNFQKCFIDFKVHMKDKSLNDFQFTVDCFYNKYIVRYMKIRSTVFGISLASLQRTGIRSPAGPLWVWQANTSCIAISGNLHIIAKLCCPVINSSLFLSRHFWKFSFS